jgi:BR serine/threonine kinase
VKRGKFTMPSNLHPDVQDLLRKMLTVDVNQRITIDEIKTHPAFLYGLPGTYVIPTPFRLTSLNEPIDPSCLTKSILDVLKRIGIDSNECKQSLAKEGMNIVKEFVDLILQRTHLDDLPWENAITELSNRVEMNGFGDGFVTIDDLPMEDDSMSFSEVPKSFASRAVWLPSTPKVDFEASDVFGPSTNHLVHVMADVQKMLVDFSIPFIYPTDMLIIGKYEDDTYILIEAECSDLGTFITVKAMGQTETVMSLISVKLFEIMSPKPAY